MQVVLNFKVKCYDLPDLSIGCALTLSGFTLSAAVASVYEIEIYELCEIVYLHTVVCFAKKNVKFYFFWVVEPVECLAFFWHVQQSSPGLCL